ncbi:MAG: hypothetical protein HC892_00160 [Saprospiraceae bacterium]|nr:hypothetical protein [Saprospiraceae bacterium]
MKLGILIQEYGIPVGVLIQDLQITGKNDMGLRMSIRMFDGIEHGKARIYTTAGTLQKINLQAKFEYRVENNVVKPYRPKAMDFQAWRDPMSGNKESNFEHRYYIRSPQPPPVSHRRTVTGWGTDAHPDDVWDTAINIASRFVHIEYLSEMYSSLDLLYNVLFQMPYGGGTIAHHIIAEILHNCGYVTIPTMAKFAV